MEEMSLKICLRRCPLIVVAICNAIAEGLMQPWLPSSASSAHKLPSGTDLPASPVQDKTQSKRLPAKPSNTSVKQIGKTTSKPTAFTFSADAVPHLKAAMEV